MYSRSSATVTAHSRRAAAMRRLRRRSLDIHRDVGHPDGPPAPREDPYPLRQTGHHRLFVMDLPLR